MVDEHIVMYAAQLICIQSFHNPKKDLIEIDFFHSGNAKVVN